MTLLEEITPREKPTIMSLLAKAGLDVSEWELGQDGSKLKVPASNPKFCYNWSFVQPKECVVAMLWHDLLREENGTLIRTYNSAFWKIERDPATAKRSENLRIALKTAYEDRLPLRAIVGSGPHKPGGDVKVQKRMLDPVPWAVVEFDEHGNCKLIRGAKPSVGSSLLEDDIENDGFQEGEKHWRYVIHRQRENRARKAKIAMALSENGNRLVCEVVACGFDFKSKYGALGENYAHVHHLKPLSDAPDDGRKIALADLAIVCANCHAMIHRGGECRSLEDLSGCMLG